MLANVIAAGIIVLLVGGSARYIYKAKKSGVKCIGCPAGKNCSKCKKM